MNGTTATTIPIRDANGRIQAADPASGATDKTLVTANWVSQTGAGRPNNLIHDSGTETFTGIKTSQQPFLTDVLGVDIGRTLGYYKTHNLGTAATSGSWTIGIEYVHRYGIRLALVNVAFDASGISGVSLTNFIGSTPIGNTKVCFDIIGGAVYLVIHRVAQNNVFSRVKVLFVQKGTTTSALPFRLETGEFYTPGTTLIEEDLV